VYGAYDKSTGPKAVLTALHVVAVCASAWILFGGGFEILFHWMGRTAPGDHFLARGLVFGCAAIYFARISYGTLFLYKRTVSYGEGIGIGLYVIAIDVLFAFFGRSNQGPIGLVMLLGAVLYVVGSYVNTRSEYLRGSWKKDPAHKGRLYTTGYFRYSRHVNYFGDELLFTGYALIAGSAWGLVVPLLMACGFIFVNIPMLDGYLKRKYGAEFEAYAARTKKFVPYVY
jgi:protein-S-isoprenylcysteine O-methyltransferase Ste14